MTLKEGDPELENFIDDLLYTQQQSLPATFLMLCISRNWQITFGPGFESATILLRTVLCCFSAMTIHQSEKLSYNKWL